MKEIVNVDILIAGGGSAGFGAAYDACLHGKGKYSVAVVDSNGILGGTSTAGGVNTWEMGIGGPGVHTELAQRLLGMNKKAAILKGNWQPLIHNRPYAITSPSSEYFYRNTLRAAGVYDRVSNHNSFIFEPVAMAGEMLKTLKETGNGNFQFYGNETILGIDILQRRITKIYTNKRIFMPKMVIDCTGGVAIVRFAGCETELGKDDSGKEINGVTQIYRVTKKPYPSIDKIPINYQHPYSDCSFKKRLDNVQVISSINEYPNGDLNINPLPTIDGDEFFSGDYDEMIKKCLGRVYLHWRRLQEVSPFMRDYRIDMLFPMIGIRESYRLKGAYILTADDVLAGFTNQNKKEEIIAFSDHPVDIHGSGHSGLQILHKPYGIPYSCIVPKNIDNLLVACRGSSFDSYTAASCRLSRTMISLGEAAGTSAVHCLKNRKSTVEADIQDIRKILKLPEFTTVLTKEYMS